MLAGISVCNGDGVGFNTVQFTKLTIVPLHPAPIVDAGTVTGTAASPLALSGTVTDDGLPEAFVTTWSAPVFASPLSFADASALSTTAQFTTLGEYTLRLSADDGMSTTFDDLSFNSLPPFMQWQGAKFPGGVTDPHAALMEDPDHDGLSNLVEYALGSSPLLAGPSLTPRLLETGGSQRLTLTFSRNPAQNDINIGFEVASDVSQPWQLLGLSVQGQAFTGSGTITGDGPGLAPRQVTLADSATSAGTLQRFVRLRITRILP